MNALQSELLKYKRTFMGKLIVFFPVSFAAYAFIMQSTLIISNNFLGVAKSFSINF